MSLALGAHLCCSEEMGFEDNRDASEKSGTASAPPRGGRGGAGDTEETMDGKVGRHGEEDEEEGNFGRQVSEASLYTTEEDEEQEGGKGSKMLDLGPQVTLRQQLEKDKEDESLRRWKEQLLGGVDMDSIGENLEPEVQILSLSIISPGRPDIILAIPGVPSSKGSWFTLKEGCHYRLKFFFLVRINIVSGLRYNNTVWKAGVRVDKTKEMLGTFSPQLEPCVFELPEETTPSVC
uniref:Rho GDP-dissociation inhibitor 1 n=1 Tax=Anthurium amnicola TaxID=1678845 RepID=A0A1D1Z092_9ARAE